MAEPSPEAVAAEIKAWYFRIDNPRSIETVGQITEAHIEKALDFMRDNAGALAKAKAERIYLEQFRKSKKAILFGECDESTVAAKENWAYAHPDYVQILDGLKAAIEEEERLKWMMTSAELKVEVWRTQSANNRRIDGAHQ